MSAVEMIDKLKNIGFQVTPSAVEVINGSKVPIDEIVTELSGSWKDSDKILTVEKTINLVLTIKNRIKESIPPPAATRATSIPEVPRLLRRTFFALKELLRSQERVTAGHIVRKTHRRKSTETVYLNKLVELGIVKKIKHKNKQPNFKLESL